ncbi:gelsolin-related protein of 125 kDa-like [Papaver somniferum]|uniref:gelsolin-related protein of 125 kDa-like n=1 Tax=Papaver somniferum TaxID=3469 RepID=UPI000E70101D|nr:gelsolin-related protein of 125 kDa-like [Papaver somniferum]
MNSSSSSDSEMVEKITEEIPNQTNPVPPETLENQNSDVDLVDQKTGDSSKNGEEKEGEEEEAECGFCLYMKGGGCKDSFIAWEKCMEEAEEKKEDVVEKCYQVTLSLKNCMEAHPDYYAPILKAEKAAEQQVTKGMEELNKEKESKERGGDEEVKEIEIEIEIENDNGIELQNKIERIEEEEVVKKEKSTDLESVVAVKEGSEEVKEVELNNEIAEEELVEKKIEKQTDSESVVAGKDEKEDEEVKEVGLNNKVAEEESKNPVMSFFDKVFSFKF